MGPPMTEQKLPDDAIAAGQRAGEIIDMFSRDKAGGRNNGFHRAMSMVSKNEKGSVHNTFANLIVIVGNDPPLAGMVGFNEFTDEYVLLRAPPLADEEQKPLPGPYPRTWRTEDVALVQAYIQKFWISKVNFQGTETALITDAAHRRFHPIRDWLSGLQWDGTARIDSWLLTAFGCPDDDYHAAIGSKFLIAAVRRIRNPGCKFDHMPVFEGDQGLGKSTVIRELFGAEWFSDSIPDELASRDAALGLLGIWVLEFAEIQHLIRNEVEVIKAFLSRSTDRYRPPYGKNYVQRPRHGVLVGTTNANDYLRDTSGNRRIWPVRCAKAELEWVVENRDQLWAEAARRESSGEAIWLHEQEVQTKASEMQSDRMSEDVWVDVIEDFLQGRIEVRIPEILSSALQIPRERQGKREEMRAASILNSLSWKRLVERSAGKVRRVWRRETPQ